MDASTLSARPATGSAQLGELATHVRALGATCPWTKAQDARDMLYWTRKECLEVEEVLRKPADSTTGADLTKELGDVLFDVMMLIQVSQRSHPGVSIEACSASAIEKLKTRAPYVFGAGAPTTVAEASAYWAAGKDAEQRAAHAAPRGLGRESRRSGCQLEPAALPRVPGLQGMQESLQQSLQQGRQPAHQPGRSTPAPLWQQSGQSAALRLVPATAASLAAALGSAELGHGSCSSDDGGEAVGGLTEWEKDFARDAAGVLSDSSLDDEEESSF